MRRNSITSLSAPSKQSDLLRFSASLRPCGAFAFLSPSLPAAVVDRVAVVVGNTVITETEVLQEARLEAFLNGAPLDLGPAARRAAAERLVDQQLVRNEMRIGAYPQPTATEIDDMLSNLK